MTHEHWTMTSVVNLMLLQRLLLLFLRSDWVSWIDVMVVMLFVSSIRSICANSNWTLKFNSNEKWIKFNQKSGWLQCDHLISYNNGNNIEISNQVKTTPITITGTNKTIIWKQMYRRYHNKCRRRKEKLAGCLKHHKFFWNLFFLCVDVTSSSNYGNQNICQNRKKKKKSKIRMQ